MARSRQGITRTRTDGQPRGPDGPLERSATGRPRRSAGSRSSSSPSRSAALVGTKSIDPNTSGAGRVRPDGQDPRRRLQAARRRERPRPERLALARAIPPSRPRSRTSSPASPALDVVQNVRSPLDPANAGQIAKNGHAALVEFEIRGDRRRGRRQDRPGPRPGRRGAEGSPAALHRRVRRRERGQGRRRRPSATTSRRPGCSRSRSR